MEDVVVGVCDGADMDSGTAWEMGYAYGKGKPTIAIRTDFRKMGSEGFNLMVSKSVNYKVGSVEYLLRALELLEENQLVPKR